MPQHYQLYLPIKQPMWLRKLKPRFGLRTLLVLVTVVAIPLGWGAHFVRKVRRTNEIAVRLRGMNSSVLFGDPRLLGIATNERHIPQWLGRLGGEAAFRDVEYVTIYGPEFHEEAKALTRQDVEVLAEWPALRDLTLEFIHFDVDYGGLLAHHSQLESLDFDGVNLAKCRFEELRRAESLTRLTIFDEHTDPSTFLHDRHIKGIGQLRTLRELYISSARSVTEQGLASLSPLTELTELNLTSAPVLTDGALDAILSGMSKLESLTLRDTQISDAAADSILKCTKLKRLVLNSTNVGDQLVAKLLQLPNLEFLALTGCAVTDDGINDLLRYPRLNWLVLIKSNVTVAGINRFAARERMQALAFDVPMVKADFEALKQKMPKCKLTSTQFESFP